MEKKVQGNWQVFRRQDSTDMAADFSTEEGKQKIPQVLQALCN